MNNTLLLNQETKDHYDKKEQTREPETVFDP